MNHIKIQFDIVDLSIKHGDFPSFDVYVFFPMFLPAVLRCSRCVSRQAGSGPRCTSADEVQFAVHFVQFWQGTYGNYMGIDGIAPKTKCQLLKTGT